MISTDRSVAMCMRVSDGAFSEKDIGHGIAHYHRIGERPKDWKPPPTPQSFDQQHGREKASADVLDRVYRALFGLLELSRSHRANLRARGLSADRIVTAGYRSFPDDDSRPAVVRTMVERFGVELLTVPGFYLMRNGRIWLAGQAGLLIPVRDIDGRTVGVMVRRDNASGSGKYRWLSASKSQRSRGGVGSGTPFHVSNRDGDSTTVYITEGILKAEVAASFLPDNPIVGLGGLSGYKNARFAETLKALHACEVVIAFDADAVTNPHVKRAKEKLCRYLLADYEVQTAEWDIESGKGIDDLLAAGGQPELSPYRPKPDIRSLRLRPGETERVVRECESKIPTRSTSPADVQQLREAILRRVTDFAHGGERGAAPSEPTNRSVGAFAHFRVGGGCLLISATQGVGKTQTTFRALEDLTLDGQIRPVFALPRHDLIQSLSPERDDILYRNPRLEWLHIRPRIPLLPSDRKISTQQAYADYKARLMSAMAGGELLQIDDIPILCPEHRRADALGAARWNVVKNHCTVGCSIGRDIGIGACAWHNQFKRPRPVLTVHETFFFPRFCEDIFYNGEVDTPQIAVLDEPSPSKFVERVTISVDNISQAILMTDDIPLKNVLRSLRAVLEGISSETGERFLGRCAFDKIVEICPDFALQLENVKTDEFPLTEWAAVDSTFVGVEGEKVRLKVGKLEYVLPASGVRCENDKVLVLRTLADQFGLQSVAVSTDDVPLNFVADLLGCLRRDVKRYSAGMDYNSALVLDSFSPRPTIRMNLRKEFRVPAHVPLICLDAHGDENLLARLIGRDVEVLKAHPLPADTRIVQVVDGTYGITSLWNSATQKPKSCFNRLYQKLVRPLIEKHGAELLIVTWKRVADHLRELQESGEIPESVAIEHYGNLEGTNAYESRRAVVLLGTPSVNRDDLAEMANSLFIEDAEPISTEQETVWSPYSYCDGDGLGYEAMVRRYRDERMEMLARIGRDEEIVQAAHRIRPILSAGKSIYLLTNLPISELPPTQLMTVNELSDTLPRVHNVATNRFTKEAAKEVFDSEIGASGHITLKRLKAASLKTFVTMVIGNTYDQNEKRLYLSGFPADSTLTRWLHDFAQSEGLTRTRVVIEHRALERGGGATWTHVYHDVGLTEDFIRAEYGVELEIEPVDRVVIITDVDYDENHDDEDGLRPNVGRDPPL